VTSVRLSLLMISSDRHSDVSMPIATDMLVTIDFLKNRLPYRIGERTS
jgi:hypothetical protein